MENYNDPEHFFSQIKQLLQSGQAEHWTLACWLMQGLALPEDRELLALITQDKQKLKLFLETGQVDYLKNVRELDLSKAGLHTLPPGLWQLTRLQKLNLSDNPLGRLPQEIGQLTCLWELYLDNTQINSLPESFGQLPLHTLWMAGNHFAQFPQVLSRMSNLQNLDLGGNRALSALSGIGRLVKLKRLIVKNTAITPFPAELTRLKKLEVLNMENCPFDALPAAIGRLSHLKKLLLAGEGRLLIPPEIAGLKNSLELLGIAYRDIPGEEKRQLKNLLPYTQLADA